MHWALTMEAAEVLKKDGSTTIDERGLIRKHPANQIFRDNSLAFCRYASEFGLLPSSRSRIPIVDHKIYSELGDLLN